MSASLTPDDSARRPVPPHLLHPAAVSRVIRLSLEGLSRYRLRTTLATLGIVIGVAAVTAMISVAEGARREVIRQVELLGLHNAVIRPHLSDDGGSPRRVASLSLTDVEYLRVVIPFATGLSPIVERVANLNGPSKSLSASVLGVSPDYQRIMTLRPARGRLLVGMDVDLDNRVCLLGSGLSRLLYGGADPVGQVLPIEGEPYTVVGVLEVRGSAGTAGGTLSPRDLNVAAIVPVRHGALLGQPLFIAELWLQIPAEMPVGRGAAMAASALGRRHPNESGFDVLVPRDLLEQRLVAQRTFNVVLGSVAVLSLLVAGIGIMNMMLASVLERTTEIGLRRSVGATRSGIAMQFLAESLVITLAGGVAGVVTGAVASIAVTKYSGWPTHVSIWAIVVSLLVAGAVGLFFGTYPARRAAGLQPVDALRYE